MEIAADKVGEVIVLARQLSQERTGPDAELDGVIEALDDDERADLAALLWVGRGDFEPEDWDDARRTALDEPAESLAGRIRRDPQLADHLEAGLELLGRSARDAEDDALAP